jgi:hypothetical protein
VLPDPDNSLNDKQIKLMRCRTQGLDDDANPYVNSGRRAQLPAIDYIAMLKTTEADLVCNLRILKILPLPSRDDTVVSMDPDLETLATNISEGDKAACGRPVLSKIYLTYPVKKWSHDPFQFELDLSSAPAGKTGWAINGQTSKAAASG